MGDKPTSSASDVHGAGDFVDVPRAGRVYYEVEGDGPETVVVVPGGPGTSHCHYHPWFSALDPVGRVVYLDYPGTGFSDRPGQRSYTVAAYAHAIGAIADALGGTAVSLVALSFGGIPALELALMRPQVVKRLVLSNAQLDGNTWQRGNIDNVNRELREQLPEVWSAITTLRAEGVASLDDRYQALVARALPAMEWYRPDDHPALLQPATPEETFNPDVYRAFCGDDPEWVLGGELATHDRSQELASVTTPTLLITGRHDRLTPPWIAHEIKQQLVNAPTTLVSFEQSAHRPWAEEPSRYFGTVGSFLRDG